MANRLGQELRNIRTAKGFSLREVERETEISNAYLSQLENGDVKNPSPHKLRDLASFYDVPYEALLKAAGYIDAPGIARRPKSRSTAFQSAILGANLSPEEETAVAAFISSLRRQTKKQRNSK